MTDLADFLLARIADEEDLVRSAQGIPNRTGWQLWTVLLSTYNGNRIGPRGSIEASPSRMSAELDAKRRIVEEFRDRHNDIALMLGDSSLRQRQRAGLFVAVKLLALPYADHPDYREEWRP